MKKLIILLSVVASLLWAGTAVAQYDPQPATSIPQTGQTVVATFHVKDPVPVAILHPQPVTIVTTFKEAK